MVWTIEEVVDDDGRIEWFVFDEERCPRSWHGTESEARAALERAFPLQCGECGMTAAEWMIEEGLNPTGRTCCDEPIADEPSEEEIRQAMAEFEELKVREMLTAALRRAPSPRELRRAMAVWDGPHSVPACPAAEDVKRIRLTLEAGKGSAPTYNEQTRAIIQWQAQGEGEEKP